MNNLNRRRFLQLTAGASASMAACSKASNSESAGVASFGAGDSPGSTSPASSGALVDDRAKSRVLVVVDLVGGNDGLSTVVPASNPIYHDLRPDNALGEDEVLSLGDKVGLNPYLTRLSGLGLAYIEGVGPKNGDLSHFAMADRWARGDLDGTAGQRDGFLARITRTLGEADPLTGVSLAGTTPHFFGPGSSSLSLGYPGDLWFLTDTGWDESYNFANTLWSLDGADLGTKVGKSYDTLQTVAQSLAEVENDDSVWERFENTGNLGNQLLVAGTVIGANLGTKVFYTSLDGFDTHEGHRYSHEALMEELDNSVATFLEWMQEMGRSDDVVVATISEFGRRVPENGSGLDHGSASTMLLAGAVPMGAYGQASPLEDLDEDGNLRTQINFDRYLATLSQEWLGVEAASVLPGNPEPLGIW